MDPEAPLPEAPNPWAGSTMPPRRDGPPYLMTEMIAAEPALAERLARRLAGEPALETLVAWIRDAADGRAPIAILGCGTSEHAAEAIAGLWTDALGRPVHHAQALETLTAPQQDGVVVAISHEGGTRATNDALRAARDAGARTALITVSDRSPGAAIAELIVQTGEQDQSWCHTVGYLSPLVAGAAVTARLDGATLDPIALRALLQTADDAHAATAVAERLAACDRIMVVGSGIDHAAARELALKVTEGAHVPAQALHLETILHGHLAAADAAVGLVAVITAGPPILDRARDVLRAARALGMPAAAIVGAGLGDDLERGLTPAGRLSLPGTALLAPATAAALGSVIPLQQLAERLARASGTNPDTIGREDPAQAAAHH